MENLTTIAFPKKIKNKGRPSKIKKSVIGLDKKKNDKNFGHKKFIEKNEKNKIHDMLKWLGVPDIVIVKVLRGNTKYDCSKFLALTDSFDNDCVDIQLLKKYMTPKTFEQLGKALVQLKKKKYNSCGICDEMTDDAMMVNCDGCLLWFHFDCVGRAGPPDDIAWFCNNC